MEKHSVAIMVGEIIMSQDTQSRKWQITINNPLDKGFSHDKIKQELSQLKSVIYWCMADETGEKQTHHTHIYACFSSAVRFSTLKNKFNTAHIEMARGSSQQNRDYIAKEGKWENDAKHGTKIPGTFDESGEMPIERQGARNDLADLLDQIKNGASDCEIIEDNPDHILHIERIERVRQSFRREEYKNTFRLLEVTYIYGLTATGKTRSVMEMHGYENVYRVTDYKHPFDGYSGQDILLIDEFDSQFPIQLMLNLLDGYPLELPCRYSNKQACYTKVYIISNIELFEQYAYEKAHEPNTYKAFLRRIHKIIKFPLEYVQETLGTDFKGSNIIDGSEDDVAF